MKMRSGLTCVISAVAAVSLCGVARAADLRWDVDGAGGIFGTDGSGSWDLVTPLWNDTPATTNLNWVQGSNAVFGDPANTAAVTANSYVISLMDEIVVNDLQLNNAANGGNYNFDAPNFNSLTVNGNIIKNGNAGPVRFDLLAGPFVLGAGNHVIALRDTPGGANPEMLINANISGSGGITLDNRQILVGAQEAWGTLSTTGINTYTGQTNINFGRLAISQSTGLGTSTGAADGTVIDEAGTLSIGGPGLGALPGPVTLNESITIKRNTYAGGEFGRYGAAIISENGVGNTTIAGPFIIDSNDARVAAFSSTLTIASNIAAGPNATTPMLSVTGDFAGFVHLTGNNTALTGGVSIINAVQLEVDNDNQIGGPTAPLNFVGGGTYHPIAGYATSFGSHVLNNATFNGGINVDAGQTFTIDQALGRAMGDDTNRVGTLGKRGTGTMNINASVNLRGGQSFWDGGIVNVNVPIELANLHLRSPVVNIGTGGSISMNTGFSSFGQDSTGTNGGPDIAVINITGTGKLIQTNNDDFNISDNQNTKGTINLSDSGVLTTAGITHLGKQKGATGTINQSGGTLTANRSGNFAFVVGRDNGTGVYNLSGGTMSTPGEAYVGQGFGDGVSGSGTWTQTGGTATISNWFVVGREGGKGTVDISAGSLIKKGGGNTPIGEGGNGTRTNSFTVRGTGTFDAQTGEVWVSNGNTTTTMTVQDSGVFNVNNWLAVGRNNTAIGILNVSGNATVTKAGSGNFTIGSGGGSNGTVNQTGGSITVNTGETYVAEGGNGTYNFSGGTLNAPGLFDVGHTGGGTGTFNVSATAVANIGTIRIGEANSVNGIVNLNGGTINATTIVGRNSTGTKTFSFAGGTLAAGSFNVGTGLTNTGTGKLSPGLAAVGATAITGTYTQGATASMAIDLASAASFDTVSATGAVTLDGPVNLALLGGYVPNLYTPVSIVTAPSVTGIFSSVNGIVASPTRRLAVTYNGTSVLLQAAEPGDANLNGSVEFQDLVALAQNYNLGGKSWVSGDFTGDGTVEFADLVLLAQFYNTPATFQSDWAFAQSIAPEPASLMVLGFAGLLGMRKRSR
jgi:hypothetical protein